MSDIKVIWSSECLELNNMQVERDMCFLFALDYLKRALDFSNALVYNLLRKRIGRDADLPSVLKCL